MRTRRVLVLGAVTVVVPALAHGRGKDLASVEVNLVRALR